MLYFAEPPEPWLRHMAIGISIVGIPQVAHQLIVNLEIQITFIFSERVKPVHASRTRFSNGLAYDRAKVSVTKSEIGFAVINFSRSIFSYMSNNHENG